MLKRVVLFSIMLAFLPMEIQVRSQEDAFLRHLRIAVEGEPPLSRSTIEAMRRSNAPYDFRLEFVSLPRDPHDVRLVVSGGKGTAWCRDSKVTHHAWFFYNSVVALAPDGKMLFTLSQSGSTARQSMDALAREMIRKLYSHSLSLKATKQQSDFASGNYEFGITPLKK
ncbi:MAG: hypothetical protein L0229_10995 [Blastocatellia bacterium]|nr:hypothetical protein [Blastocatellia bacterium]